MSEVTARTEAHPGRTWLASYPPTVPAEIPPLKHRSLGELFEESCALYADRPAFSSMGKSLTFRQLEAESRKIAAWLQAQGLVKGDRVVAVVPVCAAPGREYGVRTDLAATVAGLLGEARGVAMLKTLHAEAATGQTRKVVDQVVNVGREAFRELWSRMKK